MVVLDTLIPTDQSIKLFFVSQYILLMVNMTFNFIFQQCSGHNHKYFSLKLKRSRMINVFSIYERNVN